MLYIVESVARITLFYKQKFCQAFNQLGLEPFHALVDTWVMYINLYYLALLALLFLKWHRFRFLYCLWLIFIFSTFNPLKTEGIFDIYDITKVSDIPSQILQTMDITNQSLNSKASCESFCWKHWSSIICILPINWFKGGVPFRPIICPKGVLFWGSKFICFRPICFLHE